MICTYPPRRYLTSVVAQDVVLVVALLLIPLLGAGSLAIALAAAIAATLGWGIGTLHFPTRIELDERGVTFSAYGRAHRFAWSRVERVRVRRFLVRDRVLVRLAPSPPWKGRYWLTDGLEGFDELVRELERREAA